MQLPLEELFESSLGLQPEPEAALGSLPTSRGVLLFADQNSLPIQLITAAGMRRVASARLAEPAGPGQSAKTDLRAIARRLFYTSIAGEFHCTWLYNRLVHALFPERADELITLPRAHCVRIDPQEEWAAFTPSSNPLKNPSAAYFGPFPARKDAEAFCRIYNDIFELCRSRSLALSGQGAQKGVGSRE